MALLNNKDGYMPMGDCSDEKIALYNNYLLAGRIKFRIDSTFKLKEMVANFRINQ